MFQQGRHAPCAQTKRLGMCLFARANLTHRCLLKAPRFPYCLPLVQNSSPSVQVSSATLHHPPTWQQNMFVLELLSFLCGCPIPHPPHLSFFYSLIIITVGVLSPWQANYGRGVYTSTSSCDSHQFFSIIKDTGNHLSYHSSPPNYHLIHHHPKWHIAHRHSGVVVLKMVLEHSFRKN